MNSFGWKEALYKKPSVYQSDGGFSEQFAVSLTDLHVPQQLNYKSLWVCQDFAWLQGGIFLDSSSLMKEVSEHTVGPSNNAEGPGAKKR